MRGLKAHRYDPGAYTVLLFTAHNRKRGRLAVKNFQRGVEVARRWRRRTGGSTVLLKCLFNDTLVRGAYPAKWQ